ncbi:tail protein X [Granulibacter bethesdensis]
MAIEISQCWRQYGNTAASIEKVYRTRPHIATEQT